MNQLALLGDAAGQPNAYVPKRDHVRGELRAIHDELRGSPAWPWGQVTIDRHRERTLPHLYGLLGDDEEAATWQARIEAEMTRLEASSVPL